MTTTSFRTLAACIALVATLAHGDGSWSAWLADQATPRTREVTTLSADGGVNGVVRTREYDVRIKQIAVDEQRRDADGILGLVKQTRTTEVHDTFGGKLTLQEEGVGLGGALVPRQIVEEVKTPNRTVITTQTRDAEGHLVVTRRATRTVNEDGSVTTEVEERNASGSLALTQRTTER